MGVRHAIAIAAFCASVIHAQAPPQFEAVSIKPNNSGEALPSMGFPSPNRLVATNISVRDFIQSSYQLYPYQVIGAPDWTTDAHYDIVAKAEEAAPSPQQRVAMMKSILSDRFKMVSHTETRDLPVYVLVAQEAGKLGPQIRPTAQPLCTNTPPPAPVPMDPREAVPCGYFRRTPGDLAARKVSMSNFAAMLTGTFGRTVLDRTEMTQLFDLELKFAPAPGAPSIFTALKEQLNLKLEDQKGPVEVLIIDHVERPTEN